MVTGEQRLILRIEGVPRGDFSERFVVARRELRLGRKESVGYLLGESPIAQGVPSSRVLPCVLRDVGRLGVQRPVNGEVREVHEERLLRLGTMRQDERDRLVGEIVSEIEVLRILIDRDR